jgi:hypothetical protein
MSRVQIPIRPPGVISWPNPSSRTMALSDLANRSGYQESFWGQSAAGRRVRLTTSPPSVRRLYTTVVFNLGYTYPLGHGKTSYGVYKIEKKTFRDEHWIIRARFRVSHRRPRRKDIKFGSAISLSLSRSYNFASLKYICSFINFIWYYLIYYFWCNLFNLF